MSTNPQKVFEVRQMASLFDRDEKTIRKHINNVFLDCEVEKESNTHLLRLAHSDKPVAFYTLNVIISVGYRVKSQRGVQFRQWANRVLKQYLVKGYAVNERRVQEHYTELRQLVQILGRTISSQEQRSLTLTDDAFTKIILTTDNIPTHTLDNGIIMMNVFEYLLG